MIRRIRGTVLSLETDGAVVDVSGFGILVSLPSALDITVGETIELETYLAVKQDGVELYGFRDIDDLRFFTKCLLVPGVGPKTAMSVLKKAPRKALEGAIATRDISYLTRVVGLGKKSAEKMIVELAEKMGSANTPHDSEDAEVFDTLVALGYTEREARKALTAIPETLVGKDARLKAALSGGGR
jgi:Holliday junction DNA helicase RuvA